jgi:hypothetical protein
MDLGFFGKSLHDGLLSVLEDWRPPTMKTELEYRNALFERLRKALPENAKPSRRMPQVPGRTATSPESSGRRVNSPSGATVQEKMRR